MIQLGFVLNIILIYFMLNNKCFKKINNRSRPGKQVNLTEAEVRGLCIKARDIFINQPILLELEAPIKICGKAIMK